MHQNVAQALDRGMAVVALESAVLTHGLPHPNNEKLGLELEEIIKSNGASPATIALINGIISIGITADELSKISTAENSVKVSSHMMGIGIAKGLNGGTTVAATLVAAHAAGIQVFATGGIGGVHRGQGFDISADLDELAHRPVIVVCAGAKSILDLPATLEALETRSVPVLGYQTDEFPAFYTRTSGLKVDARIDTP
jgi:pseudouridine-5'-phosphate glycosidase